MPGERPLKPGIGPWSGVSECADRCWPDVCLEGGWSDFAFAVRVALGSRCVAFDGLGFAASVSLRLPLILEGERPSPFCSTLPVANRGMSFRPSKVPIGSIPGPTLFRGARAAGFGAAGAGNWLCRLVRIAMFVVGGGIDALSAGTGSLEGGGLFVMPGLRVFDWLKRRIKELLRDGRVSPWPAVNGCMFGVLPLTGGWVLLKLPGTGKSLRLGSYVRLLAKSSKLTVGRKSYESPVSVGS